MTINCRKLFNDLETEFYRDYGARVTTKATHKTFWKILGGLLWALSFGRVKSFDQYTVTLGKTIYFPLGTDLDNPSAADVLTLVHEGRGHLRQIKSLGTFAFLFRYFLIPVPILGAYFRYKFEREAFVASYYYGKRLGWILEPEVFIKNLSGPAYLWAMPERWIRKDLRKYIP